MSSLFLITCQKFKIKNVCEIKPIHKYLECQNDLVTTKSEKGKLQIISSWPIEK